MSDAHGRDGHDLPPCPKIVVRCGVGRARRWYWFHWCPWHGHSVASGGYLTWAAAFAAAETHARRCEAS